MKHKNTQTQNSNDKRNVANRINARNKKNHTQQNYNSLQRKAKYYKIITFDKMDDD